MAVLDVQTPLGEVPAQHQCVSSQGRMRHIRVALLRQGVLGYASALLVAWYLAARGFVLPDHWTYAVVAFIAAWLLCSFATLPAFDRARSIKPSFRMVQLIGIISVVCLLAQVENTQPLRNAVVAALAAPAVLAGSALLHRHFLRRTPTVLVGQVDAVERLEARWAQRCDVNVVATCSWHSPNELAPVGAAADGALAEVVRDVLAAVHAHGATSVVMVSGRALTSPVLRHLAWALQRAEVECLVVADMNDHVEYLHPRRVGDQIALSLRSPNNHLMSLAFKSAFDRVAAMLALVLLAPLLVVVGIAIKLSSHGPAIFRQVRTGRDGVPFTIWKFRTMIVDAEERLDDLRVRNEGAGPLFKLSDDPRITRLGLLLRKTSIDELPQLINVLRGDMSLVGPRPALESETSQYSEWVWRRLHVKPGLTGLWQVSGRSTLSWEESIRLDLQYVNNWTLRLDAAILARTVRAVLARDGAL